MRLAEVVENLRMADPVRRMFRQDANGAVLPPAAPGMIGPYRIVREIGRGGMGVVYEAEQQQPRRRVAVKLLYPGYSVGEGHDRAFRRETQALARLTHPFIAAIHDAGWTDEGRSFLVMELVQGVPLSEHVRRDQPPTARRLELWMNVCDAIAYAHQRGVIHRDLKPSNILVVEEATRRGGQAPRPAAAGKLRDEATKGRANPQSAIRNRCGLRSQDFRRSRRSSISGWRRSWRPIRPRPRA